MLQSFNIRGNRRGYISHLSLLRWAFLIRDRGVLEPAAGSCRIPECCWREWDLLPFPGLTPMSFCRKPGNQFGVKESKGGSVVANMGSPVPPGLCWTWLLPMGTCLVPVERGSGASGADGRGSGKLGGTFLLLVLLLRQTWMKSGQFELLPQKKRD